MFRYRTVRHLRKFAETGKLSRGAEFYIGRRVAEKAFRGGHRSVTKTMPVQRELTPVPEVGYGESINDYKARLAEWQKENRRR